MRGSDRPSRSSTRWTRGTTRWWCRRNRRFSKGLLFNVNYTLSKATDDGQNSTTFIANSSSVRDPNDLASEEGVANFDRRHRFVASFHYAPEYLWGIQVGGVLTIESGLPIDPLISGSVAGTGAVLTGSTNGTGGLNRAPFLERNSFRQDGRRTVDLRLSKSFDLADRGQLVVLWEAFNIFNTVNYTTVLGDAVQRSERDVQRGAESRHGEPDRELRVPGSVVREQHALRAARHAAGDQVYLVG